MAATCAIPAAPLHAFETASTINPAITANPIEVVIWVKEGVTPENQARVLDLIQQGLQMWEDVPTSEIAFQIVEVIVSSVDPGKLPHQLQIIVGNAADLTSGGASLPSFGNPGTWFGAVADSPTVRLVEVTMHEVGHTMGLWHTTISDLFPVDERPIMNWAIAGEVLLQDDIAAISSIYPNPGPPNLVDVAGTLRGRLVSVATGQPISGVNVVAIDAGTGVPAVARISGAAGSPGTFELLGLPPATYEVHLLDGHSYRGGFLGFAGGFQADNFVTFATSPVPVSVGGDLNLGDVSITLLPLGIDGVHVGPVGQFDSFIDQNPVDGDLPSAGAGEAYEIWLHVAGGLREITGFVTGLPPGLTGSVRPDPRVPNVGIHGGQYVWIQGIPTQVGSFPVTIQLNDAQGAVEIFGFDLLVDNDCTRDADGDMVPDCIDTCLDADGDGFGVGGGGGNLCLGFDCNEAEPDTYEEAPEVNDSQDNQCPGDLGFGLVDEITGDTGFFNPADNTEFSWPPQTSATSYMVTRSLTPEFSSLDCVTFIVSVPFVLDPDVPPLGGVLNYVVRPGAPNLGSWGKGTQGERTTVCGSVVVPRVVFVTSVSFPNGNLGGLAGADASCQNLAVNAGLGGTYKAWLSDSNNDVKDRMTQSPGPYQLVNGTQVASSFAHLINCPFPYSGCSLDNPIDVDENENATGQVSVYTATLPDGTGDGDYDNCNDWTSTAAVNAARSGRSDRVDSQWTSCCVTTCNTPSALYCVEQGPVPP